MAVVSCRLTGEGLARALELGGVPRREPCPQRYRRYLEKDATQMPAMHVSWRGSRAECSRVPISESLSWIAWSEAMGEPKAWRCCA